MASHRPVSATRRPHRIAAPEFGLIAEDLQAALTAASRLQQRGLSVQVVDRETAAVDALAVIVDLNLRGVMEDPVERAARWTKTLQSWGCRRIGLRFDSALRGDPAACLAGMIGGTGWTDPLVLVVPGYPSAGRVCLSGHVLVPSLTGPSMEIDVCAELLSDASSEVITLESVTAGANAVHAAILDGTARGIRRFVLDATADSHLVVASQVADRLFEENIQLVTASSGGWLRFFPALGKDSFAIVAAAGVQAVDRAQLDQIANAYGHTALITTASEMLTASDQHVLASLAEHRIVVIHEAERGDHDPWVLAADLGSAVRRVLDTSTTGPNRCQGVVASGGLTTSCIIRALQPVDIDAGQELEPLCPAVRLRGGPYDSLAVISKASGVGSPDTCVRLVRRLIGT